MAVRRTVSAAFAVEGTGVHSGAPARATIRPGAWGSGIVLGGVGRVGIDAVTRAEGATALGGISTVEHLLAALWAAGVTDARIDVDGPEVPILDGSAAPWARWLAQVGLREGPDVDPIVIHEGIAVAGFGGVARATPFDGCALSVTVDFDDPTLPRGRMSIALSEFDRVADARTFVLARDVDRLRAAGRGRGAHAGNTVVIPGGAQRTPDEPIRHKLLDLVGDLALLGAPLRGRVEVLRGSHALHHALVRRILGRG